ncbi:glycosyltransferase family 31 protein [Nemania sp. FL0916]|nr:glycosyltransferase family 31 protein [Nemania sp. FL0916]
MLPRTLRKTLKSCRSRPLVVASFVFIVLLYHLWQTHSITAADTPSTLLHSSPLNCPKSPLVDDVLVVVRTGATEVLEKLPVHFDTVLKCVPDYIIYSDFEEDVAGHHVYDVLNQTSDHVRETVPEFWLYNKLRSTGRKDLEYQTLFGSGPAGAQDNPGWKLDKWKFMPMADRALQHRPDAKWFVFVEPDTYMVWQNVLTYLSQLEHRKPYYLGRHMYIGKVLFAHGGSSFMISNAAMKMVTTYWREKQDWFDDYTAKEWAGDMILGRAMADINIPLVSAAPHVQGDSLTSVDWTLNKQDKPPWCYAPLSFHHMTEREFHILWQFENAWLHHNKGNAVLRFRDVFKNVIHPRLQAERINWDNLSGGTEYSRSALSKTEREAQVSFKHCQAACESKPSCIQYSHVPGKCVLSNELRLGHEAESRCLEYSSVANKCIKMEEKGDSNTASKDGSFVSSGWIMDRVMDASKQMDKACQSPEGNDWVH